jgi:hypothetical protein
MFRLIKKKDEELGASNARRTVLDLGLSTPRRPARRSPTRPHPAHPEAGGTSLGDILAPVLEGRDREEHRDRHLQRLSFFNRQLAHLTSFLQVTPNVPMAPGARRALESVVSAVADLDHFLAAECSLSESPASAGSASLDEAGLGELVVDGEVADPETLKAIELDLLGMRDEVVTIHAELAEDRTWLELLRSGEKAIAEELRQQITETFNRAGDLLRECQDTLSRVPLHDDRLVDDLVAAEPEEIVDDVEPFALDLDEPPPPAPARLTYDEEEAFSLGDALAQVAVPPRKAAAPPAAPPAPPAPARPAPPATPPAPARPAPPAAPPPPLDDDEDAFSLGDVLAQVPVPPPKAAAPPAPPRPPAPAAPPPPPLDEVGFSLGENEAPLPGPTPAPAPAPVAAPAAPAPVPAAAPVAAPAAPAAPAPPVAEAEAEAQAPPAGADPEEALRKVQQFFNDNSPAGSLAETHDGEFRSRIAELLRAAAVTSSLSDNAMELRLRQLKSTLGLRKKLNNRMTLPELLGFFR